MAKDSTINPMDAIKANVKLQAKTDEALAAVGDLRKLSEEEVKLRKQSMVDNHKRAGISNDIAEEMTNTYFEANMEQNKILEASAMAAEMRILPEQIAAHKRQEMVDKFGEFETTLRQSIGGLGTAIKDDFGQLAAMFGSLDSLPGFKTIKALLTMMSITLGKLLLQFIKERGLAPKAITNRISKDKDGINLGDTLRNFTPDVFLSDEKKEAKGKDIAAKGDQLGPFEKKPKKPKGQVGIPAVKDTFLQKTNKKFNKSMDSLKEGFTNITGSMKTAMIPLKTAGTAFVGGISAIGVSIAGMATAMWASVTTLAVSVASFVGGLLASAASILLAGITMLLPVILIGLGVAALVFGLMYLRDKFIENKDMIMARWEVIKEGFAIALDGLVLWKDKAVTFISNTFKKISLGIQNMMVSILEGIEGAINWVIGGINKSLGWAGVDLDEVDIGASGMRASFDEDKAAFEVEKQNQSDEFARRQKDIDDRKSNNTMERGMTIVNQNANTVNEGSKDTTIVPTGTEPQDSFAGNMALAQ